MPSLIIALGTSATSRGAPNRFLCVRQTWLHAWFSYPCSTISGKVLGGSSAINFLVRMRASRAEYDSWEELGNIGWNWNGLLEHFKRTEHYVAPIWGTNQIFPGITKAQDEEAQKEEPDFVGHDGPVWHTYNQLYTEALEPTIRGLNSLGIRTNRIPVGLCAWTVASF